MILIIGYGNTLRRDDGLGCIVAEMLGQRYPEIEIITAMQLTIEMAESFRHFDAVIFIDAEEDHHSGEIHCQHLEFPSSASTAFTHFIDAPQLLQAAHLLHGHVPDGYLFSVVGKDFGYGEGLSPVVQAALPLLLEKIQQTISLLKLK